jgi:hypothetical protein
MSALMLGLRCGGHRWPNSKARRTRDDIVGLRLHINDGHDNDGSQGYTIWVRYG